MTLCTKDRNPLLSTIVVRGNPDAPIIELSAYGRCVENSIIHINDSREDLHIDHYVIMPNHIHLLVTVADNNDDSDGTLRKSCATEAPSASVGCGILDAPAPAARFGNRALQKYIIQDRENKNELTLELIPKLISSLKRYTNKASEYDLWQSGYYDHIIRDEQDYLIHREYIEDNPAKWAEDKYYDIASNRY